MLHPSLALRKRRCFFVRPRLRRLLVRVGIVAALAFCASLADASELLSVNEPLPAKTQNKGAHAELRSAIAAHQGHPLVISFWASWCDTCREEMPALQRLSKRWNKRGLAVITVAVADTPKQVKDTLEKLGVQLPVIHDPEQQLSRSWGVGFVPTTLILDARRRIRLIGQGPVDWDDVAIDRQIQPLFK